MPGMADDQSTAGMLALVPDDPAPLAVDGGHDPDQLHLTLLYLGDDVTGWPPEQVDSLRELIAASAPGLDPVDGRVMGRAAFNPDGGPSGEMDPVMVYLVGDAPGITPVRDWAQWVTTRGADYATPPEQHDPFIPHVTVADGSDADQLTYAGPVRFSAIRLALAGDVQDFPLGVPGADEAGEDPGEEAGESAVEEAAEPDDTAELKGLTFTPPHDVREIAATQRGAMAYLVCEGKAMDTAGLDWVAEHCGEPGQRWAAAMRQRVEVKDAAARRCADEEGHDEPEDSEILRRPPFDDRGMPHPRKRTRQLQGRAARKSPGALAPEGAGLFGPELKVMSPDPRAAKLREYWAHSVEGRAKWRPGTPGDFKRLRRKLAKFVHDPHQLDGLTANIHKLATGEWPGPKAHTGVKALDSGGDLSPYAQIGATLIADDADDPEQQESWEDVVGRDDVWQMDASGVMRRISDSETPDAGIVTESPSLFGPGAWIA
jgi:2'-5' RNA ligase